MSNSEMSKVGKKAGARKVALYHNIWPEHTLSVPRTNLILMDVFPSRVRDEHIRTLLKAVKHEQQQDERG